MATTYTLISSNVLSGSAASVTFSSIPSTYTDLVLRFSARTDDAVVQSTTQIEFNADTSTNYSRINLRGDGSAASSISAANQVTANPVNSNSGASATSNTFGSGEIYVPSYIASQNKPLGGFSASETNAATGVYVATHALLWRNSSTISSIKLTVGSGANFVTGSSFYLYGIKNS